ncbi:MAG: SGNH/GDSL hydrolase family protein [Oscillospiraceae bacterium]|nr:SGNH/GDSL hydrolase family protein [Oscillospiraceae bacterium]
MFYKNKYFYPVLALFCIAILSFIAISSSGSKYQEPESSEPVIESQPDEEVQAEVDPYDKTVYETEIVKYTDIILPLNSTNGNYLAETLFVGDSNTEGIGAFEHLPMQNVLGKHSMNIQGFTADDYMLIAEDNPETEEDESQYITMYNVLVNRQPQRIIINFGTNNAGAHAVPEQFARTYADTLSLIKAACPNTKIVVAAILPVCKDRAYPKIMQDVIDLFNIELAKICKENGYGFLHYPEIFKDSETGYANPDYFSSDGVHLNGSGYRLLLDYAAKHQYN